MVRRSVIALLAGGALVWVAEPSQAQFVLYDNFSTGVIDPAKWQGFVNEGTFAGPTEEAHRMADSGALRVRLVSWGDDATDTGSVRSGNGVNIVQLGTPGGSGFITGLKAKVTVLSADAQDCPSNAETANPSLARTQVIGTFFNDGSSTGSSDRTGDILAVFELQKRKDGSTLLLAEINRCTNAACSPGSTPINVAGNPAVFNTDWTLNSPLTLRMVGNQVGGKFAFTVTDPLSLASETIPIIYAGTLTPAGPPVSDVKSLRLLHDVENCNGNRKSVSMDALFDNVNVRRVPAIVLGPTLDHCFFSWSDVSAPSNPATLFNIYVGTTAGGPYAKVGSVPAVSGQTSYGPTANMCGSLPEGQKFAVMTAQNDNGESVPSNEIPFALGVGGSLGIAVPAR